MLCSAHGREFFHLFPELSNSGCLPGRAGGLLTGLVKAVGLHDEIKDLIQSKIDEKLRGQKILLPKEVRAYKVVIHSADFIALDGDGLGLKISASGSITQAQLSTLLNKRVGEAK